MKKNNIKKRKFDTFLLEFINEVLEEEAGGGGEGGVSGNPAYQVFLKPFADVLQTATYGIEKLSTQVQSAVKGLFFSALSLFVPFLSYDYSTFREQEGAKVEELKKKYEGVLKSNIEAIVSNDAFGMAFLFAPGAVLASQLLLKGGDKAIGALNTLAGGSGWFSRIRSSTSGPGGIGFHDPGHHSSGAWSQGMGGGGGGGEYAEYSGIYEDIDEGFFANMGKALKDKFTNKAQPQGKLPSPDKLQKLAKDPKFISQMSNSPLAKQMKQDGVNLIVSHIQKFMSLNDYNEMRKRAQGDVGFSEIGQKLSQLNQSGQVPQQDNPTITAALVPELKKAYKEYWIKQMQQLMKVYPESQNELANGIKTVQAMN